MSKKLVRFNSFYLPEAFGLINDGVLCYFNSLIQALMGCTSFNEKLLNTKNEKLQPLIDEYINIYNKKTNNCHKFIAILNNLRINKPKININSQSDIHETLIFLLETLDPYKDKFQTWYKSEILCKSCNKLSDTKQPSELIINIEQVDSLETHIKRNLYELKDYKCDCGASNSIQLLSLIKVSEIIVLLFKKYQTKTKQEFPNNLRFRSSTGELNYKLVSQIEHFGSMYGGHYTCKSLRVIANKNLGLHLIERCKQKNNEYYKTKIIEINEKLSKTKTYNFNDNNYNPDEFNNSINTYMVFYHLY